MKGKVFLALLAFAGFAQASYVPGTSVYYFPEKDPMTDANTGRLIVAEVNDTQAATVIGVKCLGNGDFDIFLKTKNPLMTAASYENEAFPKLMYRMDSQPAKTISTVGVIDDKGAPIYNSLAFGDAEDKALLQAFIKGNKVAIRVLRDGMSQLDYTFNARGFTAGFKAINNCK